MSTLIHPDMIFNHLLHERRRCFVINGRHEQGRSKLARKMAERYQGDYLDLLAEFSVDPQLSAQIEVFTPRRLKEYLKPRFKGHIQFLDELDFIWYTWDTAQKEEFLTILKMWDRPAFVGVFLLSEPVVENFTMLDQDRQTRIFSLRDLQAI